MTTATSVPQKSVSFFLVKLFASFPEGLQRRVIPEKSG